MKVPPCALNEVVLKYKNKKKKIGSDDSMNQFIYKALNDNELSDSEFRLYILIKELGNNFKKG